MSHFSLESLTKAVKSAAAIRSQTSLQPAGGEGDKIFPSTYEGGKYAFEFRQLPGKEEPTPCVLIDSVQSQANRFELSLLEAFENGELAMPVLTVDFGAFNLPKQLRITSLEAPHRHADALLRDSLYNGVPFRQSAIGKPLDNVDLKNAAPLLELCPMALLAGSWDSTGPKGGLGPKFARAMVSEIVGINVVQGVKTSSRLDPAEISKNSAKVYMTDQGGWTLDSKKAIKVKGKEALYGKEGKPSEINHGNIVPSIKDGGFTIEKAVQTTVISLAGLRKLRFPIDGEFDTDRDLKARTLLAALGLFAAVSTAEKGYDLRSRCLLFPEHRQKWEILANPGGENPEFELTSEQALEVLKAAIGDAKKAGLPWHEGEIVLQASPELGQLVLLSQESQIKGQEGDE